MSINLELHSFAGFASANKQEVADHMGEKTGDTLPAGYMLEEKKSRYLALSIWFFSPDRIATMQSSGPTLVGLNGCQLDESRRAVTLTRIYLS